MAIDPGAKSGVCLYDTGRKVELFKIIPDGLDGFKIWWRSVGHGMAAMSDAVVCESFELEEGSHGIDYESPLQIIHWLKELDIPIVWQRRMQRGKNTVASVAVLKRAGLYPKRGELKEGHQVAALQHALSFLIKQRHLPTIELLHPRESL